MQRLRMINSARAKVRNRHEQVVDVNIAVAVSIAASGTTPTRQNQ
jgi:hypothetical protein